LHQRVPLRLRQSLNLALSGQSVATVALSLAIDAGYQEIGLYGVDHDWILNLGVSRHSYAEANNPLTQHGYKEWASESRLDDECRSYVELWADYRSLAALADKLGVRIVNVSRKSLLDLFERQDLDVFVSQEARS
jgi:hypothetical protein